jgi:hypothetical protein
MKRMVGTVIVLVSLSSAPAAGQCVEAELAVSQGVGYGYGLPSWPELTAAVDAATASVTVLADLEDGDGLMSFDALWVDQRWTAGSLTSTEEANIAAFIASGRRVVMWGDHVGWSAWNAQVLTLAGGSYSGLEHNGTMNTAYSHQLTSGVSQVEVGWGGVADSGGTPLFDHSVATLWGAGSVLTILDVDGASSLWDQHDNAQFYTNVADWIGCYSPLFADDFESGSTTAWSGSVP